MEPDLILNRAQDFRASFGRRLRRLIQQGIEARSRSLGGDGTRRVGGGVMPAPGQACGGKEGQEQERQDRPPLKMGKIFPIGLTDHYFTNAPVALETGPLTT